MFRYALGIICALLAAGCDGSEEPEWDYPSSLCGILFTYDQVSDRCVCVDGYVLLENRCVPKEQICDDSRGLHYSDEKGECVCADGLVLMDGACQNVDECAEGLAQCGDHGQCQDVVLSLSGITLFDSKYNCICDDGFKEKILDSGDATCVDIDECAENYRICGSYGICRNIEGGYRCECEGMTQLSSDGLSCVDVNECDLGLDFCGAHGICRNYDIKTSSYGYSCDCEAGYTWAQRFDDLHACVHKQCGWGFEKVEEGGDCVDIDECAQNMHACGAHGQCQNRVYKNESDKYRCLCDDGYEERFIGEGEYRCEPIH